MLVNGGCQLSPYSSLNCVGASLSAGTPAIVVGGEVSYYFAPSYPPPNALCCCLQMRSPNSEKSPSLPGFLLTLCLFLSSLSDLLSRMGCGFGRHTGLEFAACFLPLS